MLILEITTFLGFGNISDIKNQYLLQFLRKLWKKNLTGRNLFEIVNKNVNKQELDFDTKYLFKKKKKIITLSIISTIIITENIFISQENIFESKFQLELNL